MGVLMNLCETPIWSVTSGHIPDFEFTLPFKCLISNRKDVDVLRTMYPPYGLKGVKMGHIRNLRDIHPSLVVEKKQKLLTESTEKGIVRSGSTCNRYLATLSHLMSLCEKQWEWIAENPVRKIFREKESRERTCFLNEEERKRLLQPCKENDNPYLLTFVILQMATGARYNEIRCLKVADLDLIKESILIRESKNGDMRSVPVRGLALELLKKNIRDQSSLGLD